MIEIEDLGRLVVDETGRPEVVLVQTTTYSTEPGRLYVESNEELLRTAVEAHLNWCVSTKSVGIAKGWGILLVVARGRRYGGVTFEDWRSLEKSGKADLYRARREEPDAAQVLSLRFSVGGGILTSASSFEPGGVTHPKGAAMVYSPSEQTMGIVEYQTEGHLIGRLVGKAYDLPAVEPRLVK